MIFNERTQMSGGEHQEQNPLSEIVALGDAPKDRADHTDRKQSRMISRVLSPAVKLWLRSQLDQVEDLELEIEAGDRQLLSGSLHQVIASANKAIYQGLHFSQVRVTAQAIQTNLGQVLRGKPFRLLVPFPVSGTVTLSEADLNTSLHAPLLGNAVSDFLLGLLHEDERNNSSGNTTKTTELQNIQVNLQQGGLIFNATLMQDGQPYPLMVQTQLVIERGNHLRLDQFRCQLEGGMEPSSLADLPTSFTFDLGSEVCLEELTIYPEKIVCRGRITVIPA
ncbi:DUF2993 domain-containing protein [Phormidium sp. CLA17]|uniref:LmeA family phospholipid-binding protein n=1 Tax=Leptolyngbya sp. Cla-17 TaxID=2803751 RepID=UPI001491A1BA|nr:DUF2993 domain-containing protein [Leptolyngbya sp. Cla-17]MBM0740140.1 DUF2993 domain-containing protein [Leptolyngbya sp. Cla-17]